MSLPPRGPVVPVLIAYFLSGAAALGYEVLWARWLGLQFGVSNVGVLIAVFAFLLGLGLGALLGLRWAWAPSAALRFFARVELGVAAYMLGLPVVLHLLSGGWTDLAHSLDPYAWMGLQGALASLVLTVPSVALGAAFTVLVRAWRDEGADLARLYGWNTLGGMVGGMAPLVLLPSVGWQGALWVVAGTGVVAGLLGWVASRRLGGRAPQQRGAGIVSRRLLFLYGLVGVGAVMLEIAWTRLFGLVFLRTEYVMGVILAAYLLGVGAGGLLARHLRGGFWLALIPLVVGGMALFSGWSLHWLGGWVEEWDFSGLTEAVATQSLVLLLVTLPTTLALGAWFPLLAKASGEVEEAGPRLYAVNSIGGALGALLTGLVVVPLWGSSAALVLAALLLMAVGLWMTPKAGTAWAAAAGLAVVAPTLWSMPEPRVLLPASYRDTETLYRYEDAVSITHVVARRDGQRLLLSDLQRMDASTDPDAVAGQRNQVRLPLLLHPDPRRVLLLGLGTGISASAALALPELEVTAVELSRGAIEAADHYFQQVNLGVTGRIRVVHDDARRFLLGDSGHYDVIVGDLFHPDLVGRSALLSVQQFQRARDHLATDGLFVQWLTLNQFDLDSLRVVLRSFARVFPDGQLFMDGFRLAMVGGAGQLRPMTAVETHRRRLDDRRLAFLTGAEGVWTWLGRYWGGVAGLGEGPVQDEWRPRIEYQLPRARYQGGVDVRANVRWLLARRPSVEEAALVLGVAPDRGDFRRAYAAAALGLQGFLAALEGNPGQDRWVRMAYEANPKDRWVAETFAQRLMDTFEQARVQGLNDEEAVARILSVRPDFLPALRLAHRLARQRGDTKEARRLAAQIRALSPYERLETEGVSLAPVLN